MKKLFGAAAMVMVLTAPALAQKKGGPAPEDAATVEEKRQAEAADRAYKNAMKNTSTGATVVTDPWANTRGEPAPAPAKKTK